LQKLEDFYLWVLFITTAEVFRFIFSFFSLGCSAAVILRKLLLFLLQAQHTQHPLPGDLFLPKFYLIPKHRHRERERDRERERFVRIGFSEYGDEERKGIGGFGLFLLSLFSFCLCFDNPKSQRDLWVMFCGFMFFCVRLRNLKVL
jgi:hypothetical protein